MGFEIPFLSEEEKPQNEVEPTLTEVLNQAAKAQSLGMCTMCPAQVIRYDKDKQLADVRPSFKRKGTDGKSVQSPIIYNVPIAFPRANTAMIAMPLGVGDNVMLHFADRSLEKWKSNGGEIDNDDDRSHDFSDAVAYPGLNPFNDPVPINNSDDLIIKVDKEKNGLEIRVKPNGHIQFLNSKHELISVLNEIHQTIREAVVYTSTGPQKLRHANLVPVQKKLKTFLEQ